MVAGVVLYPLALGLGAWDPYRLGHGDPWSLATLLAVALAALVLDTPLVTFRAASALLLRGARAPVRRHWRLLEQKLERRSESES